MHEDGPNPKGAHARPWWLFAAVVIMTAIVARVGSSTFRQRWIPFAVDGASMQPALESGEFVIVDTREERVSPGDIVVVRRPDRPGLEVVKRVSTIQSDGSLYLLGDHAAHSTDSRHFGSVPKETVIGVVRWRYWPPWRIHRYA